MKTTAKVKSTIANWYAILEFNRKYDDEFYDALDNIYVDEEARLDGYDLKCTDGKANLLHFLYFTEALKQEYRKRGIPDSILIDTAKDLVRWTDIYSEIKNELYLGELSWLHFSLSGKLTKLGRLQFCPAKFGQDVVKYKIKKEDPTLDIHIPASGPLNNIQCRRSLETAKDFYKEYYPELQFNFFNCHSWLLDPTIDDILGEGSNITAFRKLFDLISKNPSDAILSYVVQWGMTRERLADFNCKTRLAKAVQKEIAAGREFYSGLGIIMK